MPIDLRLPDDDDQASPLARGAHVSDLWPAAVATFSREELLDLLARAEGAESIIYPAAHFQQLVLQALAALPRQN